MRWLPPPRRHRPPTSIELGPRSTLLALARRCGIGTQIRTLAPCGGPDDDGAGFARVAAQLYADGLAIRFDNLYRDESRTLKRLPPYAFGDGTRFWREPVTPQAAVPCADRRDPTPARRPPPAANPTPPPGTTPSPRPCVTSLPRSAAMPPMRSAPTPCSAKTSATTRCCSYASSTRLRPNIRNWQTHPSTNCYRSSPRVDDLLRFVTDCAVVRAHGSLDGRCSPHLFPPRRWRVRHFPCLRRALESSRPGHRGESARPRITDPRTSPPRRLFLCDTLADELGPLLTQPHVLLGQSMGAIIAFTVAQQRHRRRPRGPDALIVVRLRGTAPAVGGGAHRLPSTITTRPPRWRSSAAFPLNCSSNRNGSRH